MHKVRSNEELLSKVEIERHNEIELRLQKLKTGFNMFSFFKDIFNELVWTRVFSFILDSKSSHNLGIKPFLYWMNYLCKDSIEVKSFFSDDIISKIARVNTITEWTTLRGRRIDVLIELYDKSESLIAVLGLENKLYSPEQEAQLKDYQFALAETFKDLPKILIYSTPDGKKAHTAFENNECPHVCISYSGFQLTCSHFSSVSEGEVSIIFKSLSQYLEIILHEMELESINKRKMEKLGNAAQVVSFSKIIPFFNRLEPEVHKQEFPFNFYGFKTFSTSDVEVYVNDFKGQFECFDIVPSYVLQSKKNPDVGDFYVVRLMIWFDKLKKISSEGRQNVIRDILERFPFPNNKGQNKHHDRLVNVWTSQQYALVDLADRDKYSLINMLNSSIKETYPLLKKSMKQLFEEEDSKTVKQTTSDLPVIEFNNMVITEYDTVTKDFSVTAEFVLGKFKGSGEISFNREEDCVYCMKEPTNKQFWDWVEVHKKLKKPIWEKYFALFQRKAAEAIDIYLNR